MTDTTKRPEPQPRIVTVTQNGSMNATYEAPFSHTDGWTEVTVGWHENQFPDGRGTWIARCSAHPGCMADHESSQMHAMAELVRSLAALCSMYEQRETALHRAIHNSPDALTGTLRDAERDLHAVQTYITTNIEPTDDNWDAGLKPLWRAERALEAFAARIAAKDAPPPPPPGCTP